MSTEDFNLTLHKAITDLLVHKQAMPRAHFTPAEWEEWADYRVYLLSEFWQELCRGTIDPPNLSGIAANAKLGLVNSAKVEILEKVKKELQKAYADCSDIGGGDDPSTGLTHSIFIIDTTINEIKPKV